MPPTATATTASEATPAPRGAHGRVAAVHAQTRRGLAVAAGFVVAAVACGVGGVGDGWWISLHLFTVGGLLTAISAATQMLAVTWSAAPAGRASLVTAQRRLLAVGAIALVVGRARGSTWLFAVGGSTVITAMLLLAVLLLGIRRRAVTDRYLPVIDAYLAAAIAGAIGMAIGIVLGVGEVGARAADLRSVHLTLNLFGLVGLVVAATLPSFAATQVRSKMSPRATPTALRATVGVLAAATAMGAVGHLVGRPVLAGAGLFAYAAGLVGVVRLLPLHARKGLTWGGPRVLQIAAGLGWWAAATVALAVDAIRQVDDRTALQVLVIGGFAQILVGSLAYLGPVIRGGGHRRLAAGFATTRSWVSLVAGNIAAIAAAVGNHRLLAVASAVWGIDLVARAIVLRLGRADRVG